MLIEQCYIEECPTRKLKTWCGKKLIYQLDHINGNPIDNRIENLRLICANCHSQTTTYAGKKNKRKRFCKDCPAEVKKNSTRCKACNSVHMSKLNLSKDWPDTEWLLSEIKNTSLAATARKIGKSFNGLKKYLMRNGVFQNRTGTVPVSMGGSSN